MSHEVTYEDKFSWLNYSVPTFDVNNLKSLKHCIISTNKRTIY